MTAADVQSLVSEDPPLKRLRTATIGNENLEPNRQAEPFAAVKSSEASVSSLTAEQKARLERNRQLALERRRQRQEQGLASSQAVTDDQLSSSSQHDDKHNNRHAATTTVQHSTDRTSNQQHIPFVRPTCSDHKHTDNITSTVSVESVVNRPATNSTACSSLSKEQRAMIERNRQAALKRRRSRMEESKPLLDPKAKGGANCIAIDGHSAAINTERTELDDCSDSSSVRLPCLPPTPDASDLCPSSPEGDDAESDSEFDSDSDSDSDSSSSSSSSRPSCVYDLGLREQAEVDEENLQKESEEAEDEEGEVFVPLDDGTDDLETWLEEDRARSQAFRESNFVSNVISTASAADVAPSKPPKDRAPKQALVAQLLCRWWYVLPDWPPKDFNYDFALRSRGYRNVPLKFFEYVPTADENGLQKVFSISGGYLGLYRDAQGKLIDVRPVEGRPSYDQLMLRSIPELHRLVVTALENQLKELESRERTGVVCDEFRKDVRRQISEAKRKAAFALHFLPKDPTEK